MLFLVFLYQLCWQTFFFFFPKDGYEARELEDSLKIVIEGETEGLIELLA